MHIEVLASDSAMFVRGRTPGVFKACVGTCLSIGDANEFTKKYEKTIKKLLISKTKTERSVFKSYDIAKYSSFDTFQEQLRIFFKSICCSDLEVVTNLIFSSFNTKKIPTVKLYGTPGTSATKDIKTINFLDVLNQYFPYICAWKTSKMAKLHGTQVFLDSFQGEMTNAWEELTVHHHVEVIPRGDQCNPFISAADLINRYIDVKIREFGEKLDTYGLKDFLKKIGLDDPKIYHCGSKDLGFLTPKIPRKIQLDSFYAPEMVFVLKEGIIKNERKWIEESIVHQKLLKFTESTKGGLKYVDYAEDTKNIRNGDYLVYLGDDGKKQAEFLTETLGYPAKIVSVKDI